VTSSWELLCDFLYCFSFFLLSVLFLHLESFCFGFLYCVLSIFLLFFFILLHSVASCGLFLLPSEVRANRGIPHPTTNSVYAWAKPHNCHLKNVIIHRAQGSITKFDYNYNFDYIVTDYNYNYGYITIFFWLQFQLHTVEFFFITIMITWGNDYLPIDKLIMITILITVHVYDNNYDYN
jgi:hypothetical protein